MAFNSIEEVGDRHLHIIWANGDPVTSEDMVLMYAHNSVLNGWWDKVTVVIWGAPQLTIFENESVMMKLRLARNSGVEFSACISCARDLDVMDKLEAEGIEAVRWGQRLSLLLQNGKPVITI